MDLATVDKLLTTTHTVRKRLDFERAVEPEIIQQCLEIAIQAPTASNGQAWAFMVVTDETKRAEIARYYRMAWEWYLEGDPFKETKQACAAERQRFGRSAAYLTENLHRAPVMVIPCYDWRVEKPNA